MASSGYDPPVSPGSSNFAFLAPSEERLSRLATLAERYFVDDPAGALVKLRSFAELMAKEIAARNAVLPPASPSFDQVLSVLRARGRLDEARAAQQRAIGLTADPRIREWLASQDGATGG